MCSQWVDKSQEMYNAQKVKDVGKSECLCAIQRIRGQDLSYPKGSRLPTRINYMKELETVNVSGSGKMAEGTVPNGR